MKNYSLAAMQIKGTGARYVSR